MPVVWTSEPCLRSASMLNGAKKRKTPIGELSKRSKSRPSLSSKKSKG